MANIMKTWKRLLAVPENMEKWSEKLTSTKRSSAERAVERLVEKKENSTFAAGSQVQADTGIIMEGQKEAEAVKEIQETLEQAKEEQAVTTEEIQLLTAEEMKEIMETVLYEAKDTEEIKEFLDQRFLQIENKLGMIQSAQKDEIMAMSLQELKDKINQLSIENRKLFSIRMMTGVSIGCSLLTLVVLIAYVLHFI